MSHSWLDVKTAHNHIKDKREDNALRIYLYLKPYLCLKPYLWKGLSVLPLALIAGCGAENISPSDLAINHKTVSAKQVTIQPDYQVAREFIGALKAPQRIDLGFDSAGPIVSVLVEEGDNVKAGQVLAELDSSVLNAELEATQARKRELLARLDLNKRDLERQKKLREKSFASESRSDQLISQQQSLIAQIDQVTASTLSLEKQLEKKVLYAPFDSSVSNRLLDEGAVVKEGTAVLQLLESGRLEARIGVPLRLARKLEAGGEAEVVIERQIHQAKFLSIGTSVNSTTKTIPTELEVFVNDGAKKLYDGQIIRLKVNETRSQSGVWIPVDSLIAGIRGSWDVFVLSPVDDKEPSDDSLHIIERRKVNVDYVGGGRAFVSHGLNTGDWLVDAGAHKVATGLQVKIAHPVEVASVPIIH